MIGYDLDGVLFNFDRHLVKVIRKETGCKLPYPAKEFYTSIPGHPKETFLKLLKRAMDTSYECVDIPWAFDEVYNIYLYTKTPVLFITSRDESIKEQTYNSLVKIVKDRFPFELIHTSNQPKSKFLKKGIKYFVEDSVEQIVEMAPYLEKGFLIRNSWSDYTNLPENIIVVDSLIGVRNHIKSEATYRELTTMAISGDQITIPATEYERLLEDSRFLSALHAAGVDNWEGYSEAHEFLAENEEDE